MGTTTGNRGGQQSITLNFKCQCGLIYVTVLLLAGKVDGLLVYFGKAGGCGSAIADGVTKLVSSAIKAGMDPRTAVTDLGGIGCHLGSNTCMAAISKSIAYVVKSLETKIDVNDLIEEDEIAVANAHE